MTRKNTEKTEAETRKEDQAEAEELATETKQIFQSRMRERRLDSIPSSVISLLYKIHKPRILPPRR